MKVITGKYITVNSSLLTFNVFAVKTTRYICLHESVPHCALCSRNGIHIPLRCFYVREFFLDTLQVECLVVELRLGHLLLLECQGVKCRLLLQPLKHLWLALQYSGTANRGQHLYLDSSSGTICISMCRGVVKHQEGLVVGINSSSDFSQKIVEKLPVHPTNTSCVVDRQGHLSAVQSSKLSHFCHVDLKLDDKHVPQLSPFHNFSLSRCCSNIRQ